MLVNNSSYNKLPKRDLITEKLPNEVFANIFSQLDDKSLSVCTAVSKFWRDFALDQATRRILSPVKDFVDFLIKNLQEETYIHEKQRLSEILRTINTLKKLTPSSKDNKASLIMFKNSILNILNKVDNEKLNNLKKHKYHFPNYFKNIFFILKLYKKIEKAVEITNLEKRSEILFKISRKLITFNHYVKVLRIENLLSDAKKDDFLCFISSELASSEFNVASKTADRISNEYKRNRAYQEIANHLIDKGDFEQAEEMLKKVNKIYLLYSPLQRIAEARKAHQKKSHFFPNLFRKKKK